MASKDEQPKTPTTPSSQISKHQNNNNNNNLPIISLDFQIEPHNSMKLQTGQQRIHQITSVTAPVMLKSNLAAADQHSFSHQQFFIQNKQSQQPLANYGLLQSQPQQQQQQHFQVYTNNSNMNTPQKIILPQQQQHIQGHQSLCLIPTPSSISTSTSPSNNQSFIISNANMPIIIMNHSIIIINIIILIYYLNIIK